MRKVKFKKFLNILFLFALIYLGLFAIFGQRIDSTVESELNNDLKSTNQSLLKEQAANPKTLIALKKYKKIKLEPAGKKHYTGHFIRYMVALNDQDLYIITLKFKNRLFPDVKIKKIKYVNPFY